MRKKPPGIREAPQRWVCASLLRDFVPPLLGAHCLVCGSPAMACCTVCRDRIVDKNPHRIRCPGVRVPTWVVDPYHPELARLIPTLKDDGAWVLVRVLSRRLTVAVAACCPLAGMFLVLVSSRPTAIYRRGIGHTWVLARRVVQELGIGAARLLRRRDDGNAQHTQGRAGRQRLSGVRFLAHTCRSPVILVDDVVTTEAPLAASCEALTRNETTVITVVVIGGANLIGEW